MRVPAWCCATVAGAMVALTACAPTSTTVSAPGPTSTVSSPTSPAPVRTIVRSGPVLAAGRAGAVRTAQPGVGLTILASRPSVSTSRLSSTYGYGPQHGYYVTFRLVIRNTGRRPLDLGPRDFDVRIAGQGTVTAYDGNAPYSGAGAQLDTTEVGPGQVLHGPLTFDVRRPHGLLSFAPDGSPALSWRF